MFDQSSTRRWGDLHRLLNEAEKELPSVPGAPTVEPECEFVEVVIEMREADRPLMSPEDPPLQERHHGDGRAAAGPPAIPGCRRET